LYLDLSLLSPNNFESFKNGMPNDALSKLTSKLKSFIEEENYVDKMKSSLCEELLHFSTVCKVLKKK
jgi:tRNA isopentenyl-2-thiomethyl-A-37 hydroxylase MiaE